MKNKNELPESACLDHRLVKAPYVRCSELIEIDNKNKIYKYDLRLIQPNTDMISVKILHSLEHLLAVAMRRHIDGVIDISPMGCLTGFYITSINQPYDNMVTALEKSFKDILAFKNVPFANEIQCGSAASHDLKGAKKYAEFMLEKRDNWEVGAKDAMYSTDNL